MSEIMKEKNRFIIERKSLWTLFAVFALYLTLCQGDTATEQPANASTESPTARPTGCLYLDAYDYWGDGWTGYTFSLLDDTNTTVQSDITLSSGYSGSICLDVEANTCYTFNIASTGSYGNEISYAVCDEWGSVYTNVEFCTNSDGGCLEENQENCTSGLFLSMYDAWDNGWKGFTFSLYSFDDYSRTNELQNVSLATGSFDQQCLSVVEDECYVLALSFVGSVASEIWEIWWEFCDAAGNVDTVFTFCTDSSGACIPTCPSLVLHSYEYYNGYCYFFSSGFATYENALADCESDGGSLASIADADENAFILGGIETASFIGLSDTTTEGTWIWLDGTASNYTSWADGEPSNYDENVNCGLFGLDGEWVADDCRYSRTYVCKLEASTTLPTASPTSASTTEASTTLPTASPTSASTTGNWRLLFRQSNGTYLPKATWLDGIGSPEDDNYSILGQIENYRLANGKFLLQFRWPDSADYFNTWYQTSNPLNTSEQVTGYEAVDVAYTGRYWGGLALSSSSKTLLDGSIGTTNWWYAVGCTVEYNGGFPGPADGSTGIVVQKVELYTWDGSLSPTFDGSPTETLTSVPTARPTDSCNCSATLWQGYAEGYGETESAWETETMDTWLEAPGGTSSLEVSGEDCFLDVAAGADGSNYLGTYTTGVYNYPIFTGNDNINSIRLYCESQGSPPNETSTSTPTASPIEASTTLPTASPTSASTTGNWQLLYRQSAGTYLPKDTWLDGTGSSEDDNYSILGQIEYYRLSNGKFLFQFRWPGSADYFNTWYQTSNPLDTLEEVTGYEAVDVAYTGKYWGGLALSDSVYSLLDGSVGHNNWWYAVGNYFKVFDGIPGPSDGSTTIIAQTVELYIWDGSLSTTFDTPTEQPTNATTESPAASPTDTPTEQPTNATTESPTASPTAPVFEWDGPATFDGDTVVQEASSNSLILTESYTLSVWVNPTSRATDWARVVGKGGSDYRNYGLWLSPNGYVLSQMGEDSGGWLDNLFDSSLTVPLNEWTHIAVTFRQNNLHNIYINGALMLSSSTAGTPITDTAPLTIGMASMHTGFIGNIQLVKVYNFALSASNVFDLTAQPDLWTQGHVYVYLSSFYWAYAEITLDYEIEEATVVTVYSSTQPSTSNWGYQGSTFWVDSGLRANFYVTFVSEIAVPTAFEAMVSGLGPAVFWALSEISDDGVYTDLAGLYDLAVVTGAVGIGDDGASLKFDGSCSLSTPYVAAMNTANFTVMYWAKVTGGDGTYRCPISTRRWENTDFSGYNWYCNYQNLWDFNMGTTSGWATFETNVSCASDLEKWHFLAATFDIATSTLELYVDGVLRSSNVVSDFNLNTQNPLMVGANEEGYYFIGDISKIVLFNTTLKPADIFSCFVAGDASTTQPPSALILPTAQPTASPTSASTTGNWRLLFRQSNGTFLPKATWLDGIGSPEDDNYSILGQIENYRLANGKFLLQFRWPDSADYFNTWYQTSNPLNISEEVTGYEAVDVAYTGQYWGGLALSSSAKTLLDGSIGTADWWYAVGCAAEHKGGFPGPAVGSTGIVAQKVELYAWDGSLSTTFYDTPTEEPTNTTTESPTASPTGYWQLLFRQSAYTYLPSLSTWLNGFGSSEDDNYSILDQIENYRLANGKFLLQLQWPDSADYFNTWYQTSNPLDTSEAVTGYEAVDVAYTGQYWGGLALSSYSGTLLDGSVGHKNWWYAVGCAVSSCYDGFPGPSDGSTNIVAQKAELYVWDGSLSTFNDTPTEEPTNATTESPTANPTAFSGCNNTHVFGTGPYIEVAKDKGEITFGSSCQMEHEESLVKISFNHISERGAYGQPVGLEGSISHTYNDMADLLFQSHPLVRTTFQGLCVDQIDLASGLDLGQQDVQFGVIFYIFCENGTISIAGNSTYNETLSVLDGALKFSVFVRNWPFCNGSYAPSEVTQCTDSFGQGEYGNYLDVALSIKAGGMPSLKQSPGQIQRPGSPGKWGCGDESEFSGDTSIVLSQAIKVDGIWQDMGNGYPSYTHGGYEAGISTSIFGLRFPRFVSEAIYDPTVTLGDSDSTSESSENPENVTTLASTSSPTTVVTDQMTHSPTMFLESTTISKMNSTLSFTPPSDNLTSSTPTYSETIMGSNGGATHSPTESHATGLPTDPPSDTQMATDISTGSNTEGSMNVATDSLTEWPTDVPSDLFTETSTKVATNLPSELHATEPTSTPSPSDLFTQRTTEAMTVATGSLTELYTTELPTDVPSDLHTQVTADVSAASSTGSITVTSTNVATDLPTELHATEPSSTPAPSDLSGTTDISTSLPTESNTETSAIATINSLTKAHASGTPTYLSTGPTTEAPELTSSPTEPNAMSGWNGLSNASLIAISETWALIEFVPSFNGIVFVYAIVDGEQISIAQIVSEGTPHNVSSSIEGIQVQINGLHAQTSYILYLYGIVDDGTGMDFEDLEATATPMTTHPNPPYLISAQFSSSGTSISAVFNSDTDYGESFGLENPLDCDQLLEFSGASSYCEWLSRTTLIIYMKFNSIVEPGDSLALIPDRLKARCVMEPFCQYMSYAQNSTVIISAPQVPPVPWVKLRYPSIIGQCDDLTIDASGSGGSGGRNMSFTWNLTSPPQSETDLQHFIHGLGSSHSSITIPHSYLETATTYQFVITVRNFFHEFASKDIDVLVRVDSVPKVILDAGSELTIFRNKDLTIFASANYQACNHSDHEILSYSWEINGTSSGPLNTPSISANPRYLLLEAYSLNDGDLYIATATATAASGESTSATVLVEVLKAPLEAVIAGGTERTIKLSEGILLDASISVDHNHANGSISNVDFLWFCWDKGRNTQCNLDRFLVNNSTLFLPSTQLNSTVYRFEVTVQDETRSSNASSTITVVEDNSPVVTAFSSTSEGKVNVQDSIQLMGQVDLSDASEATTRWALEEETSSNLKNNSELLEVSLTPLTNCFSSTGSFAHYLVLDGTSLMPGGTYTFVFSSSYDETEMLSSFAKLTLTVNSPPTSGRVVVSPDSGYSIQDMFHVTANAWTDDEDDFPLKYAFYYQKTAVDVLLRGPDCGSLGRIEVLNRSDSAHTIDMGAPGESPSNSPSNSASQVLCPIHEDSSWTISSQQLKSIPSASTLDESMGMGIPTDLAPGVGSQLFFCDSVDLDSVGIQIDGDHGEENNNQTIVEDPQNLDVKQRKSLRKMLTSWSTRRSVERLWIKYKTGFFDEEMEAELRAKTDELLLLFQEEKELKLKRMCCLRRLCCCKSAISQERLYVQMRNRALKAKVLDEKVESLIQKELNHDADAAILKMAIRDCQTKLEKRALSWYNKARRELIEEKEEDLIFGDELFGQGQKQVDQLSYKQVKTRRWIGWTFLTCYCFCCAFYVVLFGINYGAKYAVNWLQVFLIAFAQETVLFLAAKLYLQFYFLPWLCISKLNLKRIKKLPRYAASVQVAESFESLPASILLINRKDPSKTLHERELFANLFIDPNTLSYKIFLCFSTGLQVLFSSIFLLPEDFQEIVLDTMLPIGFTYVLIGLLRAADAFPYGTLAFWCSFLGLCFCLMVYRWRRTMKKKFCKWLPHLK